MCASLCAPISSELLRAELTGAGFKRPELLKHTSALWKPRDLAEGRQWPQTGLRSCHPSCAAQDSAVSSLAF